MSAGLQVWDASGYLVLDATYRVMRMIDSVSIGSSYLSGSVADSRLSQGGWVSFQPATCIGDGYLSGGVICPQFSISNGVLSWSYASKHNTTYDIYQDGIMFYGAY